MRLNLFFPDNHEIAKLSKKERAVKAKELIEFGLKYKEQMQQILDNTKEIKTMVASGGITPQPVKVPKSIEDANDALIKGILGM